MTAESILILGAAAVQEDAVHAARRIGLHTVVCAQAHDGPAADAGDEFVPIDILDVDALERFARDRALRLVYSVGSDLAMPVIGELADRLGLRSFASRDVAETCNNKGRLRRALAGTSAALPYQVIAAGDPLLRTVDLPCIVKPVDSQGQRGVALVTDNDCFAPAVAAAVRHSRTGGVIVEQFIGGTEVCVNGYQVDGELVFVQASDRVVWSEYTGLIRSHVVPSATLAGDPGASRAVTDLLATVCARVGLTQGPVYAQMKVEDGIPHLIEVTPRLDGCHMWQLIKLATGVDLLDATLRHLALGERPHFTDHPVATSMELEFTCQEPGTPAPEILVEPRDVASRAYYRPGATIRAVNGRFEKIGYHVRPLGTTR